MAHAVHDIVTGIYTGPGSDPIIQERLTAYAELLAPWARRTAHRMVSAVNERTRETWRALANEISFGLKQELEEAPTGAAFSTLFDEQVGLIQSIPLEAAQRVHRLTAEGLVGGKRSAEVAEEIMRSGEVAKSRAILIARTETSRTATTLVQARAQYVGSTHFIWRTVRDLDVRPGHKRLEGQVFRWDEPPECDPGYHALPGAIFNCRCWPEAVLPDLH